MRAVRRTIAITTLALSLAGGAAMALPGRKAISSPDPVYPELAKRMRITGSVKVTLTVAADGTIKQTNFHGGHPVLVDSVQTALKNWKYAPASGESTVDLEFKF